MTSKELSDNFNRLMEVKQVGRFFRTAPARFDNGVIVMIDRQEIADWLKIDEHSVVIAVK